VPAGLYLLFSGSTGRGVGLLLYGVLFISMIDNIIKPLILKGAAQIHIMLGFLSILGGLYAFGPKGLIAGPVVLSLVLSAYRIYRYDVLRWRHAALLGEDLSDDPAAVVAPAVSLRAGR
jgi:predicted PurR-regulated permease PerM